MRIERVDAAVEAALEEAHRLSVYVIARFQDVQERGVTVHDGVLERVTFAKAAGVGIQVFTREGWCGFASSDDDSPAAARGLVRHATALARASGPLQAESIQAVWEAPSNGTRRLRRRSIGLDAALLPQQINALQEANRSLTEAAGGLALRSSHSVVDDEWRVVRTDDTDVAFALPRAYVRHKMTARSNGGVATASVVVGGTDGTVLLDPQQARLLERRARRALRHAQAASDAPPAPTGSIKLVIDHPLAKGLAHEAFGHACETDIVEGSTLAVDGRLRVGEEVGPRNVSIVDGPIEGDFADQPMSANGLERQTVHIIRDGVLASGLGDLFSARGAGSPVTGACRAASFRGRPTARMSNIRIAVSDALPLALAPEDLEPEDVAAELRAAGLWNRGERMLYLSGYRGGQAHPKRGDFTFTSAVTYEFADGVQPRQPALFSGKSQSALRSIRAGLGELRLDAIGLCSKNGQAVPTSGGSHALLLLEAHPQVLVGGQV